MECNYTKLHKFIRLVSTVLVLLFSVTSYGQTTVANSLQINTAKGTAPLQVTNGGLAYFDVNGILRSSNILSATTGMSFATISSITLVRGVSGGTVFVKGFNASGDGGGGLFYWDDTATSNVVTGMILQVSGVGTGRWKRVIQGNPNVMQFGAYGDGIHDDAPAFQDAMNYGGTIFVPTPSNFYKVSSMLRVNNSGTHLVGTGRSCKIISDASVVITFSNGYNVSNTTLESLSIENLCTGTLNRGSIFLVQLDSLFDHNESRIDSNISLINNYLTASKGFVGGVVVVSHRSGFGGTVRHIVMDGNTFDKIGGPGVEILGEYDKVWCSDIRFTNNIVRHTGIYNPADGFGISISGADKLYADNNQLTDIKTIGIECTVCSYSTISNNRFDSTTYTLTAPYTFNMSGTGVVSMGKDNIASNNKTLDSLPAPPYFINQDNLKCYNNTIKYYSTYLRADSVMNSKFVGDTYIKSGTGVQPVIALRAHSTGNLFANCNIIGTSSNNQILLMQNGAKHNAFVSDKIAGNTSAGTLINNADTTVSDNIVKECYSMQAGTTGIYVNLPIASSPLYNRVIDLNGQDAIVPFGGVWQLIGNYLSPSNLVDSVCIGCTTPTAPLTVSGKVNVVYANTTSGAVNPTVHTLIIRNNANGSFASTIHGWQVQYSSLSGDSAGTIALVDINVDNSPGVLAPVNNMIGMRFNPGNIGMYNSLAGFQALDGSGVNGYTGFSSTINAGVGKYQLYMNGTAPSYFGAAIGINSVSPNASTLLDVISSTKGTTPFPRMNNTQRDAMTPMEGLFIYSLTDHTLEFYNNSTWKQVSTN